MSSEINYASKYSTEIDERFKRASVTDSVINNNFDFDEVNTVFVFSDDTAELNDYTMYGESRYGNPNELGNHVQTMKLTQDKSFTFTIDARYNSDTLMTQHAGRCLQREIDEVIIPTIDKYRLEKLAEAAAVTVIKDPAVDKFYQYFLEVNAELTEKNVPLDGRVAFITPKTHLKIKMNKDYTGLGDKALEIAQTGNAYKIDGVDIMVVPSSYLPANTEALITHPCAMVSPIKLAEYKIHKDPPGINGWLVEGRLYYDAFILNNKMDAIALLRSLTDGSEEPETT